MSKFDHLTYNEEGKIIITSWYPPFLAHIGDKTYANEWTLVPQGTKLEDLVWQKSDERIRIEEARKAKHKETAAYANKTIVVPGSKPGTTYNVTVSIDGEMKCDCVGFGFHKKCRHLKIAKQKFEERYGLE